MSGAAGGSIQYNRGLTPGRGSERCGPRCGNTLAPPRPTSPRPPLPGMRGVTFECVSGLADAARLKSAGRPAIVYLLYLVFQSRVMETIFSFVVLSLARISFSLFKLFECVFLEDLIFVQSNSPIWHVFLFVVLLVARRLRKMKGKKRTMLDFYRSVFSYYFANFSHTPSPYGHIYQHGRKHFNNNNK